MLLGCVGKLRKGIPNVHPGAGEGGWGERVNGRASEVDMEGG